MLIPSKCVIIDAADKAGEKLLPHLHKRKMLENRPKDALGSQNSDWIYKLVFFYLRFKTGEDKLQKINRSRTVVGF